LSFFVCSGAVDLVLKRATASKQRLNALNPTASVTVVEVEGAGQGQTLPQQAVIDCIKNLARADVVVVSDCYALDVLQSLNDTCRLRGSTFVVLQSYGLYAHFFCDFGPRHTFKRSGGGGSSGDNTINEGVLHYATLQESLRFVPPVKPRTVRERVSKQFYLMAGIMSFVEQTRRLPTLSATNGDSSDLTLLREFIEKFLQQHDITDAFDKKWIAVENMEDLVRSVNAGETSAVTAVAGGIAGAELIKYLTATDPTLRNWWFYHATTGVNAVESLG
jgi:molybdopterin/thiamine biosynthesis adenylyltransferase